VVTLLAQAAFPFQANGSKLSIYGKTRGSSLLAQDFSVKPGFFHARPSASGYATLSASASNLGPLSARLREEVGERRLAWERENPGQAVPSEMLYASGSGLDPDVSLETALAQAPRVARERGLDKAGADTLRREIIAQSRRESPAGGLTTINLTVLNFSLEKGAR
jgi:K+-transporting ATPase ATPase C chain